MGLDLPENDPILTDLDEEKATNYIDGLSLLGFENAYLSRTLGTAFLWILYTTVGLVAILLLLPF